MPTTLLLPDYFFIRPITGACRYTEPVRCSALPAQVSVALSVKLSARLIIGRSSGELMMVASGGVLVPVAAPISAGGVAVASHGVVVMSKALLKFSKVKDGQYVDQKQSGPNEKHTNLEAKSTAQDNYEKARAELAEYQSENRGEKYFSKKEKRLKDKMAHWKR